MCCRISQTVLPILPISAVDAGGSIMKLWYVSDSSRAPSVIGESAVHRRCVPASYIHVRQRVRCALEEVFFGIVGVHPARRVWRHKSVDCREVYSLTLDLPPHRKGAVISEPSTDREWRHLWMLDDVWAVIFELVRRERGRS